MQIIVGALASALQRYGMLALLIGLMSTGLWVAICYAGIYIMPKSLKNLNVSFSGTIYRDAAGTELHWMSGHVSDMPCWELNFNNPERFADYSSRTIWMNGDTVHPAKKIFRSLPVADPPSQFMYLRSRLGQIGSDSLSCRWTVLSTSQSLPIVTMYQQHPMSQSKPIVQIHIVNTILITISIVLLVTVAIVVLKCALDLIELLRIGRPASG